jgi:hypothetical protein
MTAEEAAAYAPVQHVSGRTPIDPIALKIIRGEITVIGKKLHHYRRAFPELPEERIAAIKSAVDRVNQLRVERRRNPAPTAGDDPLIKRSNTRPLRTPSAVAEQQRYFNDLVAALDAQRKAALERMERELARREGVRKTLLAAAREARKAGFTVRSSSDRAGRVSSYYAERFDEATGKRVRIRISDHEIPWTPEREARAADYGGFYGYPGREIIIEEPLDAEQIRKLLADAPD